MNFPIVFLCIVAAATAAPQLFFVVPQQFLDNPTQQNFQNFIPLIVPFNQQQSEVVEVNQEAPAVETQTEVIEPVAEAAAEVAALEQTADVAAVAAEETVPAAEETVPAAEETVPAAVDSNPEVVAVPEQSTGETPSAQAVESDVAAETVNTEGPEQAAVEVSEPVKDNVQEAAPVSDAGTLGQEASATAGETHGVQTNEIISQEAVESPKAEETLKTDTNSGKSFNSISSPNAIHHSIVTHFGFRGPASVKSQPNTYTEHGALVDPKTLVPVQFRHFIYQNDSPDVIAAKIAFFRVQAALTPVKTVKL